MLAPNTFVGNRYLIVRVIDGAVYEALDTSTNLNVALKLFDLSGASATTPGQLDREAQVLRGLRHPLLPQVTNYVAEEGRALLVSEFVAGESLAAALARNGRPFGPEPIADLARHMLDTLEYLHQQSPPVLHRGIKPQNIMVAPSGQLKLVDLSLGVPRAQPPQARPAGTGLGSSLQFMPPEQVQGAALDQRSDIYSLAATLYYLATGTLPALAGKRINARLRGQPDPLRPAHEVNSHVPISLSAALAQAMALDAVQRPIDVAALRRLLIQAPTDSQPPTLIALPSRATIPSKLCGATASVRSAGSSESVIGQTIAAGLLPRSGEFRRRLDFHPSGVLGVEKE